MNNWAVLLLVAVMTALMVTACNKDDDDDDDNNDPTKGGLIVKVRTNEFVDLLPDALVGIATSQEDLNNDEYLKEGNTNDSGQVYFGQLEPGTYFSTAIMCSKMYHSMVRDQ